MGGSATAGAARAPTAPVLPWCQARAKQGASSHPRTTHPHLSHCHRKSSLRRSRREALTRHRHGGGASPLMGTPWRSCETPGGTPTPKGSSPGRREEAEVQLRAALSSQEAKGGRCCAQGHAALAAVTAPTALAAPRDPRPCSSLEPCCSTPTRRGSQGGPAAAGGGVTRSQDEEINPFMPPLRRVLTLDGFGSALRTVPG